MAVSYLLWLEDLSEVALGDQRSFVWDTLQGKHMLHIFGKYFFPHIIKGHYETPQAHIELIREISSPQDSGIVFPRGFAKSTWEKIDTLHDIVYNLEPVILYISNNLTDAGYHFESIKTELENNERLRYVYGNLVPDQSRKGVKWTNKHLEAANGVNLVARGANKGRGVNIKNQRPTKAIIDDGEDDEMVRSPERRQKYRNWVHNVVIPSLDVERGRLKVIGTVIHEKVFVLDFYHKKGGILRKAIEGGKSIWPEYWTEERLEQKRLDIGTRAFMQEYMNEPTNDDLANFKAEFIDEHTIVAEPKLTSPQAVIHLDPQAGETAQADEYCISLVVWEKKDIHRYCIKQVAGKASQMRQAYEFIKLWLEHKDIIKLAGVEKVMNQTAVFQYVRDWKAGRITFGENTGFDPIDESDRNIPLVNHNPNTSGSTRGKDKLGRLQMQEAAFERGEIHIMEHMRKLRDQLLFLGQKNLDHDDRADSLLGAIELSHKTGIVGTQKKVYNKGRKQTIAGNLMAQKF